MNVPKEVHERKTREIDRYISYLYFVCLVLSLNHAKLLTNLQNINHFFHFFLTASGSPLAVISLQTSFPLSPSTVGRGTVLGRAGCRCLWVSAGLCAASRVASGVLLSLPASAETFGIYVNNSAHVERQPAN